MKWIKQMNLKYFHLNWKKHTKENDFSSSSDSDSEDDEPRRFHIEIKPVQPNNSSMPSLDELKVSIGNITLSPAISVSYFVPCIFNAWKGKVVKNLYCKHIFYCSEFILGSSSMIFFLSCALGHLWYTLSQCNIN